MKLKTDLPLLFDNLMNPERPYVPKGGETVKPTDASIGHIQRHFGVKLPESLIEFALQSDHYDCWFAGLGDDYSSSNHIVRINSHYKKIRRRKGGAWAYTKPKDFILVHADFDGRCLCLNAGKPSAMLGEYELQYWFSGYEKEFGDKYSSFECYIELLIAYLEEKAR
ncbi:hypothetical protein A9Q99_08810 [Gammaproteobacteria bacterium 45_16_T64]|nr:hypothetical protein A9Q99_08810 [Gammaproteobacteria bacterium 45_16_T64]